ncbi:MAG: thioredoxin family protein [Limnospira sp. PMC 1291.21]|uniref:Thiol:disulfide interchange protein TxlA n=3 Tax=Limnospira TaxID=2596745 RepID=A0A9P1KK02_9CYAN|nr:MULTISPECIES: thioredoxin family protein [Limnospira]EKD08207.1 putative thioredoxin-like protein [Arthrospira platensis C1]MBD2672016.1 thioredoxin family protein [Arthrospira platensis FACHB-439]MDC0839770.1 thioredoxin family protein [Limnoraphis robusta]MDY7051920.1 thioredoxin family protein [Limnospira fusiformis LS22]QJB25258.1 thioredoxin fold domain-containing protein [Limnospira fusiformis SAG 85.79]
MSTNPSDSSLTTSSFTTRLRNFLIALVAIVLSVLVFWGFRTNATSISLTELATESTPLEVALSNGKPTLMEFYANWCTTCQAMAEDMADLRDSYGDRINFVMLNVDNTKWLPEILKYRVDGIPHFVFLNDQAEVMGEAIGEIPRPNLGSRLDALIAGNLMPTVETMGQVSTFKAPVVPSGDANTDPRAHGSQVKL